jgi:O-acetylhomoserine (thiol)-lyase
VTLPRLGLPLRFDRLISNFQKSKRKYEGLFAESLGNPKLDVLDLKSISAEAKKLKVPFIVDNTVASPYSTQLNMALLIHSLTKYIAGNGTSLEA